MRAKAAKALPTPPKRRRPGAPNRN